MAGGFQLKWDSMLKRVWHALREAVRRYFVAGLLAFAPIAITMWAIAWIVERLDNLLLPTVLEWTVPSLEGSPDLPPLVGALFTFGVILLSGVIVRHLFGNQVVRVWESALARVPVARSIYAAVKQLVEALFRSSETTKGFNQVVLLEYPRKGIYALAFTTGDAHGPVADATGATELVNVFVPTTPNPTSGVYIIARREDLKAVNITVEEAFKVVMSAGIVTPELAPSGATVTPLPAEVTARAIGDE
jgi:uncharacterized membrane protein